MNREREYQQLLEEINDMPMELNTVAQRAIAKNKSKKINWRCVIAIPVTSMIALVIAFILLVNSFPTFAYACGRIPYVAELAKAVAWSPSLSAAVDNQYVQPIEMEKTVNDITVSVEYVIVDQKQLNVFYTVSGHKMTGNGSIAFKDKNNEPIQACSSWSAPRDDNQLQKASLDFIDESMPSEVYFIVEIRENSFGSTENLVKEESIQDDLLEGQPSDQSEILFEIPFFLTFDPYFTVQGEKIEIKDTFSMNDQVLVLEDVEILPTHMRINLEILNSNTAKLVGLTCYVENEKGEIFGQVSNGITASGDGEGNMSSYRIDSPYFGNSKELTLVITEAKWLNKSLEKVKVNLKEKTADYLPSSVSILQAKKQNKGWLLTFLAEKKENEPIHGIWYSKYYDMDGNEYHINGVGSSSGYSYKDKDGKTNYVDRENYFTEMFALADYHQDEVFLCPAFTHKTKLEKPIEIKIK